MRPESPLANQPAMRTGVPAPAGAAIAAAASLWVRLRCRVAALAIRQEGHGDAESNHCGDLQDASKMQEMEGLEHEKVGSKESTPVCHLVVRYSNGRLSLTAEIVQLEQTG